MRTIVKSAVRVLDLLELMAALPGPVKLSEATRRLGIPKSSASGLFSTLEAKGYVVSGPDGFALAEPFRSGGWTGGEFAHLTRLARPVMMRLVEETGESAFLGIMTSDWHVQYVEKVTSANPVRYDVELSQTRPAYNTSIGHVFLADLAPGDLDDYLASARLRKVTPYTVTGADELRRVLARVRERGYAEAERSNVLESAGVAAPVFGGAGRVIAGLAVIAPADRFEAMRSRAVAAVREAAAGISHGLARLDGTQPAAPLAAVRRA